MNIGKITQSKFSRFKKSVSNYYHRQTTKKNELKIAHKEPLPKEKELDQQSAKFISKCIWKILARDSLIEESH